MFRQFRKGILHRQDGSTNHRLGSEKDERKTSPKEIVRASSPTLQEDNKDEGQSSSVEAAALDSDQVETRDSRYSPPSILDEDEDDPHSHAAMTRRAEEILANAKKRLTVSPGEEQGSFGKVANAGQDMEGNLNRARSTLERRPSSSMSSLSHREPGSVSLYRLPTKGRSPSGFSPSKHRQANKPMLSEKQQGHYRVFSETSVPSTLHTAPNAQSAEDKNIYAHGVDSAAKERNSEPSRNWFWNGLTRNTSLNYAPRNNNGLQPLDEDGPAPESFEQSLQSKECRDDETFDLDPSPKAARFEVSHPPTIGLTRARSTTQMRDLRDQMQDLKGKISTLKQRAKEDNLRRRSLQSLRTPSPFTAAEEWHTRQPLSEASQSPAQGPVVEGQKLPDAAGALNEVAPCDMRGLPVADEENDAKQNGDFRTEEPLSKPTSQDEERTPRSSQTESVTYHRSPSRGPADRLVMIDEPLTGDVDGKEDSLYGDQNYHETSAEPIVERHEDRPDAFDYEHFILHSAMGSYSGVGVRRSSSMRKRRPSDSSASSVETTKPRNSESEINGHATSGNESSSSGSHMRKDSVGSVSTVNTFATATEGKPSPRSGDDDDWTPRQLMAGSWQTETKKHNANSLNGSPKPRSKKHISSAYKVSRNDAKAPGEKALSTQPPDLLSYITSIARLDPSGGSGDIEPFEIGDRDRELIERLVSSLAGVCANLHKLAVEGATYEARVCRQKLDTARRMLDGEVNGEAF